MCNISSVHTLLKKLKEHFQNTSDGEKSFWISILIWTVRNKGRHIVWQKWKLSTYWRMDLKTPQKSKWKKWCSRLVPFPEISLDQLKMVLWKFILLPRACMHAWQHRVLILMMNSQVWISHHWVPGWHQMGWNKMCQRCFVGFRWGEPGGQGPGARYQSLQSPGTACILSPHKAGHCSVPGGTQDSLHHDRIWQWLQRFHLDI